MHWYTLIFLRRNIHKGPNREWECDVYNKFHDFGILIISLIYKLDGVGPVDNRPSPD